MLRLRTRVVKQKSRPVIVQTRFSYFVQILLSSKRASVSCPIFPRLLRRRRNKLPDKASTRKPPIASHAVVRYVHILTTPDRPPRQHKKAATMDDLIYIDLALDLGLSHMLRLTALRGKSFLAKRGKSRLS